MKTDQPRKLNPSERPTKTVGCLCEADAMSDQLIIILASAGLGAIAMLYAVVMWNSRRSARYLLRAVGIIMVIAALGITGLSELLLRGVRALIEWFQVTYLSTTVMVGIGVGVVGILAYLIGGAVKPPTRAEAKTLRAERVSKQRAAIAAQASRTATARPAPTKVEPAKPSSPLEVPLSKPATADDEVANILKKHGID